MSYKEEPKKQSGVELIMTSKGEERKLQSEAELAIEIVHCFFFNFRVSTLT